MTFDYLIKTSEIENNATEEKNYIYLNTVLGKLMDYITDRMKNDSSVTMSDINDEIEEKIRDYLTAMTVNQVRYRTIEYYLGIYAHTNKLSFEKAFKTIIDDEKAGKVDLLNINSTEQKYTNNMNKNMETLVTAILSSLRKEKRDLERIDGIDAVIVEMARRSSKERSTFLKRVVNTLNLSNEEKRALIKQLEDGYKLYAKPEKETAEEYFKEYTQQAGKILKDECVSCIKYNTELLDDFGLLEHYVKSNNKQFKKIYINDINYDYDEVKEMFKESNLRKLNIEELIFMSTFWTNRVNKVIKDLAKALYIVNHKELVNKREEDGKIIYSVTKKDMKNVNMKINTLHKLYFELFDQLDEKGHGDKTSIDIMRYIKGIAKKHKEPYKEYFDILFPNSKNSLKDDLLITHIFENLRYNSYRIKDLNMQALLISLFTSQSKNIENFGYIKEDDLKKKEILLGVDVRGFNMPFALHMSKDTALDFVKEYNGNTHFPIYKDYTDFDIGQEGVLKAQIFVPLTKEADQAIKKAADKTTPRDRYKKAVLHLNYLRRNGKMPEHIMKEVSISGKGRKLAYEREYIDLTTLKPLRDKVK